MTLGQRAFRFGVTAGEGSADESGLALAPTGRLDMVEGPAAIRQAIRLLLQTSPGERVMRPAYGCDLQKLAFAPNDGTTAGLAIHYVREAVKNWEPRIEVLDLDAAADPNQPEVLLISLEYRVLATHATDQLNLHVHLGGGSAG